MANELDFAAYDRALRARRRSDRTIQGYFEALEQLEAFHDNAALAGLTQPDIENYIVHVIQAHSSSTAANRFRSLRAFYNWSVREEIIDKSPMARMKEPSVTDDPPQVLEDDDLRALLGACEGKGWIPRRDTAMIRLFCEPGTPRLSEMAGLVLTDLNMRGSMARLHGKGDKVRYIPFGAKTGQALDRYLRVRSHHPLAHLDNLWVGGRGVSITTSGISQILRRRGNQAGIGPIHPHQLRHTSAHVWLDSGGSEGDAMELFGWSSPDMPRRYGRSARTARAQRASRRISPADRL